MKRARWSAARAPGRMDLFHKVGGIQGFRGLQ